MSKDKERIAATKRRPSQTPEESTRATQRGEAIGAGTQEDLDQLADQLGNTWSDYVQFRAFQKMVENLQSGHRGDELQQFIDGVKYGVGRAIALTQAEIGQELDPKYLLQSSSESMNTSIEPSPWDDEPETVTIEMEEPSPNGE